MHKRDAAAAAAAYALLTIAMTWPVVTHLTTRVPADVGDPLLNCWILAWDADHLRRALAGHVSSFAEYWNANIFYPNPLALAYSEHLTVQAIEILPLYAMTKNAILCYNAIFLSTFALSGLGAYLLAREFSGSRSVAFVAGVAYAYAPYRFSSMSHVQVLSSQWMPFALWGLRRYFVTRRAAPLAWAGVAFVAQALSCGYYLFFFAPVVALYAAWEITVRRSWNNVRMWRDLALTAAGAGVAIAPFMIPYLRLRGLGFAPRSLAETEQFSANVYAYLTADAGLRLWGSLARVWPAGEGSLFPGATIATLASACALLTWRRSRVKEGAPAAASAVSWLVAMTLGVAAALFVLGPLRFAFGALPIRVTDLNRVLAIAALLACVLLAMSAPARTSAGRWLSTPAGMLTIVAVFAIAMSFGPRVYVARRTIENPGLYRLFFELVPGFDALRVPARFAMVAALALSLLAAGALLFVPQRRRTSAAVGVGALIMIESIAVPIPMNVDNTNYSQHGLAPLPAAIVPAPEIYSVVAARLPADAVLVELPVGVTALATRYMLYSTTHWRRLVNGYSGGVPLSYALLSEDLKDVFLDPDRAWKGLMRSGASHVIVHESFYAGTRGSAVTRWLRSHGAREVARSGADCLLAMPLEAPQLSW